jgi:hypothetical protein
MDLNDNVLEASTCDGEPQIHKYADFLTSLNESYDSLIEAAVCIFKQTYGSNLS